MRIEPLPVGVPGHNGREFLVHARPIIRGPELGEKHEAVWRAIGEAGPIHREKFLQRREQIIVLGRAMLREIEPVLVRPSRALRHLELVAAKLQQPVPRTVLHKIRA